MRYVKVWLLSVPALAAILLASCPQPTIQVVVDKTTQVAANGGGGGVLPVLFIGTGGRQITSKVDWLEDTSYTLFDGSGQKTSGAMSIKGRGNSTWVDYPKKPYSLKLSAKASLLEMPEHKRWTLLANYADKTLLRTEAAFYLAELLDNLSWTAPGTSGAGIPEQRICRALSGCRSDKN
jgi:hypothetical protein